MTNQINNQSIITSTDVIELTLTLKMTTGQVVETSITANNNSPIQDYVHPDDQTQPTFEKTPGFKPFTTIKSLFLIITCSGKIIFHLRPFCWQIKVIWGQYRTFLINQVLYSYTEHRTLFQYILPLVIRKRTLKSMLALRAYEIRNVKLPSCFCGYWGELVADKIMNLQRANNTSIRSIAFQGTWQTIKWNKNVPLSPPSQPLSKNKWVDSAEK